MSTDECEINYDGSMDDFDEERVNSSIIYYIQNTYQEIKAILWKKNYKEIDHDYINVKQQLDGAVNFSKETFEKIEKGRLFYVLQFRQLKLEKRKQLLLYFLLILLLY